ncbi:MAG: DUF4407 domain-containing protein [Bacteroidota bacterium]
MLTKFLIYCCGAKHDVLDQCPSQIPTYASIGATILFTAILASISGGYALYHIFSESEFRLIFSIIFGILWGLTIFNLDRLIVLSIRKKEGGNVRKEMLQASPRIVLAIFIALVIAKPLEVRIFSESIEQQLRADSTNNVLYKIENFNRTFDTDSLSNTFLKLSDETDSLRLLSMEGIPRSNEFRTLEENITSAANTYNNTRTRYLNKYKSHRDSLSAILIKNQVNGITKLPDSTDHQKRQKSLARNHFKQREYYDSLIFSAKAELQRLEKKKSELIKVYREELVAQANENDSINSSNQKRIKVLDSLRNISEKKTIDHSKRQLGLMAQLDALGRITAYKQTKDEEGNWLLDENGKALDNSLFWANIVITLLFLALETAPVFVKLMMKRTAYDELLEFAEDREKAEVFDSGGADYEILHQKNKILQEEKIKTIKEAIGNWSSNNWDNELNQLRSEEELKDFTDRVLSYDKSGIKKSMVPSVQKWAIIGLSAALILLLFFNTYWFFLYPK